MEGVKHLDVEVVDLRRRRDADGARLHREDVRAVLEGPMGGGERREASWEEMRRGEARRGEARRGEARRGEERRGEERRGA